MTITRAQLEQLKEKANNSLNWTAIDYEQKLDLYHAAANPSVIKELVDGYLGMMEAMEQYIHDFENQHDCQPCNNNLANLGDLKEVLEKFGVK